MRLVQPQPWELRLLVAAQEALNSQRLSETIAADNDLLEAAYQECEQITYENSRTFYLASCLLPEAKRQAVHALYAFCRITDDIVDEPGCSPEERQFKLNAWREAVMADSPPENGLVCLAWADAQVKFNIPRGYPSQLIAGCERDTALAHYATFADLAEYAYAVASTVGLMAMHIIGFVGEEALPYAVKLGVALQLTNILRDIGEDWQNGRLYLPQDELHAFGVAEELIERGLVTHNWRRFMAFQIERTRKLYEESMLGIALLDADGRFAIMAAAELYRAILEDIEKHDYDVFSRRAHIGTFGKLSRLPTIWWRSHQATIE